MLSQEQTDGTVKLKRKLLLHSMARIFLQIWETALGTIIVVEAHIAKGPGRFFFMRMVRHRLSLSVHQGMTNLKG